MGSEMCIRDRGNAEVAGSLAVVAGEDAEAAGVDREALVQPELGLSLIHI